MKITIDTDILKKHNLSLKEYLVLLIGYYDLEYTPEQETLIERGLVNKNLFSPLPPILSDNTRNLVARIITESDDKVQRCGIKDFEALADKLRNLYPTGVKPGTTYEWRGTTEEVAQKLRTLVYKYNFTFTEEEAIKAVQEYLDSTENPDFMQLLKYFILRTTKDETGFYEMKSIFMSIIENNRTV